MSRATAAGLLALVIAVPALHPNNAGAQTPVSHRSVWGRIGPTSQTRKVELHVELWCAPGQLFDYCTVSVTIPGGSFACDICGLMASAINNDPCCIAKCFSATCDNESGELVVSNCRTVCGGSGGYVCFDPAGLNAVRLISDVGVLDVSMPYYLAFYEPAGGVSPDPAVNAGVIVIYTARHGGGHEFTHMIEVPTYPGMTGEEVSTEIEAAFRSVGIQSVRAEGARARFETAPLPEFVPGAGLEVVVNGPDSIGAYIIDAYARKCPDAFALAEVQFDLLLESGKWVSTQTMIAHGYGNPGTATVSGVFGIVAGQPNPLPGAGPSRDPSGRVHVWRGRWLPFASTCWTATVNVSRWRVFEAEPGTPSIICPAPAQTTKKFTTGSASCPIGSLSNFDLTIKVNDTGLGFAFSSDPDLRCALAGTACEEPCLPVVLSNFDSDPLGEVCAPNGWEPWLGTPGACGEVSPDRGASGTRSLKIVGTIAPPDDVVHRVAGAEGGVWLFSAQIFVPETATGQGAIVLLNTYDDPPGAPIVQSDYSMQWRFDADSGLLIADPNQASAPLIKGRWTSVRALIDLDLDQVDYYYNGVRIAHNRPWRDLFAAGGEARLQAIDLYAGGVGAPATSGMYFDDIVLQPIDCVPPPCPGDADGDGMINFADISAVLTNWGLSMPGAGDTNSDGVVDFADITAVLKNWGVPCP